MSDTTTEPTAPAKADLKREIASIDRTITDLLFYGGDPKILINGDEVLRTRGRGKGLAIYADLERDAHAGSVIAKRKRAVTSREWGVTPASDDPQDVEAADLVKDTLTRLRFDKLSRALLDATLKGFSVAEIMWEVRENRLLPTLFKKRDQRRFVFDIDGNLRLLTRESGLVGEALPERKFITHTVGEADDSPYGRGVGHQIFWPVFFKRQNISFWLTFNDKFGSPTAKGTYPIGTSDTERIKFLQSLRKLSNDAGVIIPEGMEIELLEAARGGDASAYERLCVYMDAEISKAVLGETLTTTVGNTGGNRALGDVHDSVRIETAKDDADDLSYTLNETLVKWIVELNFPGRTPPTVWRTFEEEDDLGQTADVDLKLKSLGYERTEESVIETYGPGYVKSAPPPDAGMPADQPGGAPTPQFQEASDGWLDRVAARITRALRFGESDPVAARREHKRADQEAIAQAAAAAAGNWETFMQGRLRHLQTLLDETGDLVLFRERLQELVEQNPNKDVVEALAQASFAAHLAGRTPPK